MSYKKEYYLICKQTCPACKGNGITEDPTGKWEIYKAELEKTWLKQHGSSKQIPENAINQYWRSKGHWPGYLPPKQIDCETCGGTGIYEHQVDLTHHQITAIIESQKEQQPLTNDFLHKKETSCFHAMSIF